MKIDLTTRNAAVGVILTLEIVFLALAIASSVVIGMKPVESRAWELFLGNNGALMLAMKLESSVPVKEEAPAQEGE